MAGIKKNNYLITFLLVAMFFALLFLPEMLGLGTSPAAKIKESLSFDFDSLIPKKNDNFSRGSVRSTDRSKQVLVSENSKPKVQNINWTDLRDKKTKRRLNAIKSRTIKLANNLPVSMRDSRFALYNYAAGIDFVLSKGIEVMGPADAINHLENLDITATRTLVKENASRFILNEWSKITLGPKLSKAATKIKKKAVPPFNPKVIFKELKLIRFLSQRNNYNLKKGQVAAWPVIYYKGDDVVGFLDVYQNGNKLKTVTVGDNRNKLVESDWYSVELPMIRNGIMSIVFKSKDGEKKIKSYSFYGNLGQFEWKENKADKYLIAKYRYRGSERAFKITSSLKYKIPNKVNLVGNLVNDSNGRGNLFTKKSYYTSF